MTSMDIRSIDESSAARRRTSDWRWVSGSLPKALNLMRYRPLDCCEQRSAAFLNEPDGSLYAHQLSVTRPFWLSLPPQAATATSVAASARAEMTRLVMAIGGVP